LVVGTGCPWPVDTLETTAVGTTEAAAGTTNEVVGGTAADAGEVDREPRSRRRKTARNLPRFPGAVGSLIAML
jgi:hypothetical protein